MFKIKETEEEEASSPTRKEQKSISSDDANLVKLMKLGVALAIIRSKPSDSSAKDHAEYLSSSYMMSQHKWREKCDRAQAEILRLKQQLIMSNGLPSPHISGDESASNSQTIYPTPPSSSEANVPPPPAPADLQTLHKDVVFLQSMVNLQRAGNSVLSQSSQCPTPSTPPATLTEVTRATLEHSLRTVREAVSDPKRLLATHLLSEAVTSVVRILEYAPHDHWSRRCQNTLQEVMSLLMTKFLAIDRFEQSASSGYFQNEEVTFCRLLELLSCFYQTKSLCLLQGALNVFLNQLKVFCTHLRESHSRDHDTVHFCPVLSENMCDVLRALETCVQINRKTLSSQEGHVVCAQLQDDLGLCLLHLTQVYPLLAHAVWRVTNSLELCLTHQD